MEILGAEMPFARESRNQQQNDSKTQLALMAVAFFFLFLSQECIAKEILITRFGDGRSFYDDSPGSEVANNEMQLSLIEPGDTIVFRWTVRKPGLWAKAFSLFSAPEIKERRIPVGKLLGEGGLTRVYDILGSENTQVLRIAKNWHTFLTEDGMPVPMGLEGARRGFEILQENKISTVKVFDHEDMLFTIVEKVEGPSLEKFLLEPSAFSQAQLEKMLIDFLRFAKASAKMAQFGDLKADAIIYDHSKGWTIIDSHPSTWALNGPIEGYGVGTQSALWGAFENDGDVVRIGMYNSDITIPIKDASGTILSYREITSEEKAKLRKWILYVGDQMNKVTLAERTHLWNHLPPEDLPPIADFVKTLGEQDASTLILCKSIF